MKANLKFRIISLAAPAVGGLALGAYLMKRRREQKIQALQNRIYVLSDHFQLLNHWLEIKKEGKGLASYFEEMGFGHIAIYGMAELANRLCEELEGTSVTVDYGIDWDASCSIARISRIYSPEEELPETDAVVVTPYAVFDGVKAVLEKQLSCPILSLEEIVWSV